MVRSYLNFSSRVKHCAVRLGYGEQCAVIDIPAILARRPTQNESAILRECPLIAEPLLTMLLRWRCRGSRPVRRFFAQLSQSLGTSCLRPTLRKPNRRLATWPIPLHDAFIRKA